MIICIVNVNQFSTQSPVPSGVYSLRTNAVWSVVLAVVGLNLWYLLNFQPAPDTGGADQSCLSERVQQLLGLTHSDQPEPLFQSSRRPSRVPGPSSRASLASIATTVSINATHDTSVVSSSASSSLTTAALAAHDASGSNSKQVGDDDTASAYQSFEGMDDGTDQPVHQTRSNACVCTRRKTMGVLAGVMVVALAVFLLQSGVLDSVLNPNGATGDAPVNCQVSGWVDGPEGCTQQCDGTKTQTRSVLVPAANGGRVCPILYQTVSCSDATCPRDCQVSPWSPWSGCSHLGHFCCLSNPLYIAAGRQGVGFFLQ